MIAVEKLINFLAELGIEPIRGEKQVFAFNDAVITLEVDEDGNNVLQAQLYDFVDVIDEDIAHIVDNALLEDEEDDSEFPFDIEEQLANFMSACKFEIEDAVIVKGYEGTIFNVVGIGQFEGEVIYTLVDQTDEENYIDAYEEDMTLYKQQPKLLVGGTLKGIADELLDKYNDYMDLYNNFGDEGYKQQADEAMEELKKIKL